MPSDRVETLERGIRQLIKPELADRNFSYESSTRTFRKPSGGCIQIVDFHVGSRTMEGKFTVNLAVFHPEYHEPALREFLAEKPREFDCLMDFRRRLSLLRDTPITRFFRNRVRDTNTFLKWWLVTPTDKWWPFTSDDAQVAAELGSVRELLLSRGLNWLDQNANPALLRAAYEKLRSSRSIFVPPN